MLNLTQGANPTADDGINNPLDIRVTSIPWHGKNTLPGKAFESFLFMWQGYRAGMLTVISHFKQGQRTLNQIFAGTPDGTGQLVNGYAPAKDGNNPVEYAAAVAKAAGLSPDLDLGPFLINDDYLVRIITEMTVVEQGDKFIINPDDIEMAWENIQDIVS